MVRRGAIVFLFPFLLVRTIWCGEVDSVQLTSDTIGVSDTLRDSVVVRTIEYLPKIEYPVISLLRLPYLSSTVYTSDSFRVLFPVDTIRLPFFKRLFTNIDFIRIASQKEVLRDHLRDTVKWEYPVVEEPVSRSKVSFSRLFIEDTTSAMLLFDSMMVIVDSGECVSRDRVLVSKLSDSVIIERLQNLEFDIEVPYHKSIVRNLIINYIDRNPMRLSTLLSRSEYYFPLIDDIVSQFHSPYSSNSVPYEIRYLAVIESALNPFARSRMGACGLWQFMPTTAKLHGLQVNSLIDERYDPIKSTYAACVYLRELYDMFNDWNLAIAAYNCGPGNIKKAIVRSGGKRDFWSLYPFLPKETRGYLPIFIAACYAMNYAGEHGIGFSHNEDYKISIDTFQITQRIHLRQISDILEVDIQALRKLNPQYTKDIIPGNKSYTLVLPEDVSLNFIDRFDTILSHRADELVLNRRKEIDQLLKTSVSGYYSVNGVTYYKVRKGDNLGSIARKFRCSVSQIKRWNGLTSDFIRAGRTLKIVKA